MILFIDIETVPIQSSYEGLSSELRELWDKKAKYINYDEDSVEDVYFEKAGIYAEFSRVLCIGIGYYSESEQIIKTHSISGDDEQKILIEFSELIDQFRKKQEVIFCGHNIKEFDLPFLCRRMIIQRIELPKELNLSNVKPWNNPHVDTMDLWRFGEYKRYTSLELLATCLGIPSPKTDIDGSQVASVYYEEHDLAKIVNYCLRDVISTAKVYFRLVGNYDIVIKN